MAVNEPNQFWMDVIEGYNQVAFAHERQVTVARDGKKALIIYEPHSEQVVIAVMTASTQTIEPLQEP